jgi:hypothetical protein
LPAVEWWTGITVKVLLSRLSITIFHHNIVISFFFWNVVCYSFVYARVIFEMERCCHLKSKAVAVTGYGDLQGSETLRIPCIINSGLTYGSEVVPYGPAKLYCAETFSDIHFCSRLIQPNGHSMNRIREIDNIQ